MLSQSPVGVRVQRRFGHRPQRPGVKHPALTEPQSLTDARARVRSRRDSPTSPRPSVVGVPLALVLVDLTAMLLAAVAVRPSLMVLLSSLVVVLVTRTCMRFYRPRLRLSVLDEVPGALVSVCVAVGLLVLATSALGGPSRSREYTHLAAAFVALSLVMHGIAFFEARRARRRGRLQRTLVIGAGRVGGGLARTMLEHPELGLRPVGFLDPDSFTDGEVLPLEVLSDDLSTLGQVLTDTSATTVVMAFSTARESQMVDTIITAHQRGCSVLVVPRMFELHHDGVDVERVRGVPLIRLRPDPTLRLSWWVKRAVDTVGALVMLLVLSPVLIALAATVLIGTGRPLLFWQERIGLDGRPFRLCKFRSMQPVEQSAQAAWTVEDDPRMTRIGALLRRSSLDELPQLWNIAKGEMSFVGPRPERPSFVQQFSDEHERYWARHRVPVGLTGLAQVNGLRGNTSIRERARYDNYYIANWSLWLDLRIALLTVREIIGGGGR